MESYKNVFLGFDVKPVTPCSLGFEPSTQGNPHERLPNPKNLKNLYGISKNEKDLVKMHGLIYGESLKPLELTQKAPKSQFLEK